MLLVMWGHASPFVEGGAAVIAFFVLSGFLITRLMIEEHERTGGVDVRAFYLRRARRLLPALPIAVTLMALANVMEGLPVAWPLLAALGYVGNLAAIGHDLGSFTHMWSLAVEEHFYLLWPLVFGVLRPRLAPWCIAAGVVIAAARLVAVAAGAGSAAYYATPLRIDAMLFGAALAVLAPRLPKVSATLTGGAGAALLAASAQLGPAWMSVVATVASVLLVASALNWRRRPALERIGRISYGLYLFHVPVNVFMAHKVMVWGSNDVAYALILFLLTFPIAQLSWWLVESRFVRRRPGDPAGITPPGRRSPTPLVARAAASRAA